MSEWGLPLTRQAEKGVTMSEVGLLRQGRLEGLTMSEVGATSDKAG